MKVEGKGINRAEEAGGPAKSPNGDLTTLSNAQLIDEALRFLADPYVVRSYPSFYRFLHVQTRRFVNQSTQKVQE